MKKMILMAAVVIFSAYHLCSQDSQPFQGELSSTDFRNKLQFGMKIGMNYSNVYDSKGDEFSADSKFGLATGFFVSIPVGVYLGIQPEILFSQKGFKATGNILGAKYEFTRTSNFIDVPLLIQFKPIGYVTLLAGPQYSYLIKQKDVFATATSSIEQQEEFKNENIRKNTFCFAGGLDLNFNHLVIGTRVGWDLFKNNGDGTTTTPRYKNVWYQLTLGYRF